jgi:hypothetical protein
VGRGLRSVDTIDLPIESATTRVPVVVDGCGDHAEHEEHEEQHGRDENFDHVSRPRNGGHAQPAPC